LWLVEYYQGGNTEYQTERKTMTKQYTLADALMDIVWDMGEEDRLAKEPQVRKSYAMPLTQTCLSASQANKLRAIFAA